MAVSSPASLWGLGVIRIVIGFLWFQQILWKLPFSSGGVASLKDWMSREAAHPFIGLYGSFVQNIAIPNVGLFAWLTFLTEGAIAVSLLLGLLSRLGALVGALWALNLAIGLWSVPGEWYWTYLMLVLLNAAFVLAAAGRYVGVDSMIRSRILPTLRGGLARFVDLAS